MYWRSDGRYIVSLREKSISLGIPNSHNTAPGPHAARVSHEQAWRPHIPEATRKPASPLSAFNASPEQGDNTGPPGGVSRYAEVGQILWICGYAWCGRPRLP